MRASPPRLIALDVMRGATIAAMILVNNPGSWAHVHPELRHADWHGWTLTDLVFPFFLFIVGVAIVFSLGGAIERGRTPASQMGRVLRRTLRLMLLGLLLAAWSADGLADLRIPGVLQRISICYLAGATLFLYFGRAQRRALLVALVAGYWAVLTLVPVPGVGPSDLAQKDINIAAWIDRLLLDGHLWSQSETWDPEGILSTVSAIATVLLGLEVGNLLRSRRADGNDENGGIGVSAVQRLGALGAGIAVSGWGWGLVYPINKSLWTGSFVLWTGGLAMLLLAGLLWIVDVRGSSGWTGPFEIFGRNAITVFVLSGLLARTLSRMSVKTAGGAVSVRSYYYEALFTSWLPPDAASFAHAGAWVLLCYLAVWILHRKGIFLRI